MHPNDGRVVSNFIMQALTNQNISIYGDGGQTRSFCYVDEMVDGLIRLMGTPDEVTGPINLGNPREITIIELANLVIKMTRSRSKIVFEPLPENDPIRRQPDISKAKKLLGWEPKISLEEGLEKTISYFKDLMRTKGFDSAKK
jgi:UDP-glucuronate decarboxylase